MIVLSLNMRGGGNRVKRKRVGFHNKKGQVDICFIQESKLREVDSGTVRDLWGDKFVEWSFAEANRASGGLITMWKKNLFNLIFSFKRQGFLGLCVEKNGKVIYFVNVYASCDCRRRVET